MTKIEFSITLFVKFNAPQYTKAYLKKEKQIMWFLTSHGNTSWNNQENWKIIVGSTELVIPGVKTYLKPSIIRTKYMNRVMELNKKSEKDIYIQNKERLEFNIW